MSGKVRYRVVLDTNIIVAAGTAWLDNGRPGSTGNLARAVLIGVATDHEGLWCSNMVVEYIKKLQHKSHPAERIVKLIAYLMGAFDSVSIKTEKLDHPPTDIDDEIFVICALDGEADFLVSDDGHILSIAAFYRKPQIGSCRSLAHKFCHHQLWP